MEDPPLSFKNLSLILQEIFPRLLPEFPLRIPPGIPKRNSLGHPQKLRFARRIPQKISLDEISLGIVADMPRRLLQKFLQ